MKLRMSVWKSKVKLLKMSLFLFQLEKILIRCPLFRFKIARILLKKGTGGSSFLPTPLISPGGSFDGRNHARIFFFQRSSAESKLAANCRSIHSHRNWKVVTFPMEKTTWKTSVRWGRQVSWCYMTWLTPQFTNKSAKYGAHLKLFLHAC